MVLTEMCGDIVQCGEIKRNLSRSEIAAPSSIAKNGAYTITGLMPIENHGRESELIPP